MRLVYAIVYTHEMEKMAGFYRDGLGLEVAKPDPFFNEFRTGTTSLSLLAMKPEHELGYELVFQVDDVEAIAAELRTHGMEFMDDVLEQPFGKLVHMRDAEGTVVTLLEPASPPTDDGEPELTSVIVNTWDFGAATNFYRDRLRLPVLHESPHWIEFDTGGARLAVHARAERPDIPAHGRQKVACTFDVDDLEAWVAQLGEFGTPLATEPTEADFGTYAEVIDPDGNLVVFREPPEVIPVPAIAAEAFEDDDEPSQVGMRKPLKKGSKAVSRVALKPVYREDEARRRAGKKLAEAHIDGNGRGKRLAVVSERGTGPEGSRMDPKTPSPDPKRAKAKPATGRLKKAEARNVERKKKSVAGDSKQKPVKQASKAPVKRTTRSSSGAGRAGR